MHRSAETLTITNTGISNLTLANVLSSDNVQFEIINPPGANFVVPPGGFFDLDMRFCPGAAGPLSATLTIDHNASNQPIPIVINLMGTGL